ncbi:MAG: class IV adenylate cyclase [Chitinophagaceae bacterium]|nr:class IV adenylate cyclase [Chitinophagaceae bacterium]
MPISNFEFKAKTTCLDTLEKKLLALNPKFNGVDKQTDTYFNVAKGRLKLREGNIENALIFYERENSAGAKLSKVLLYHHKIDNALKEILTKIHGIKIVVEKTRRIYFIENVKFHFDKVSRLGTFVEVEAIDTTGNIAPEALREQCKKYSDLFEIEAGDYVADSYSDLLEKMQ